MLFPFFTVLIIARLANDTAVLLRWKLRKEIPVTVSLNAPLELVYNSRLAIGKELH
jgi:hypothetical protein